MALIGMMATGKSTLGRALAPRLGARFVDTDDQIEATVGKSVGALWEQGGEAAYRPLERQAVLDALASTDAVVLATPGGVVVDPVMIEAVEAEHVAVVHLRASAETLTARVGDRDQRRPLLGDDPAAAIAALVEERRGRYEALADLVVDVDRRSPEEILGTVLDGLGDAVPVDGRPPEP